MNSVHLEMKRADSEQLDNEIGGFRRSEEQLILVLATSDIRSKNEGH
jgi:hypothetical protein